MIRSSLPFTDNLETAASRQYYKNRFGVEGIDRYDFTNTDATWKIKYFSLIVEWHIQESRSLMHGLWMDGMERVGSTQFCVWHI